MRTTIIIICNSISEQVQSGDKYMPTTPKNKLPRSLKYLNSRQHRNLFQYKYRGSNYIQHDLLFAYFCFYFEIFRLFGSFESVLQRFQFILIHSEYSAVYFFLTQLYLKNKNKTFTLSKTPSIMILYLKYINLSTD